MDARENPSISHRFLQVLIPFSPVRDAEQLERNKSLTKEEIESFWRVRRSSIDGEEEREELRSPKSPLSGGKGSLLFGTSEKNETKPSLAKDMKLTGDWYSLSFSLYQFSHISLAESRKCRWFRWTRSNWAFLNEPPQEAPEKTQKYTAQFHVAQVGTSRQAAEGMNSPSDRS